MDGKPKIIVFIDEKVHFDRLDLFDSLSIKYDIEVIAYCHINYFNQYQTRIPVKLIDSKENQQGYLPGVESLLKDANLVVCFATHTMTTFQILRASDRFQYKVVAISGDETLSLQGMSRGEMAIQKSALEQMEHFFAITERSKKRLLLQGLSKEKVSLLPVFFKADRYAFNEGARRKFRDYINITDDEILVLVRGVRNPAIIKGICGAAKFLMMAESNLSKRFRFIWNDVDFECLKQTVFDYGLAKKMILLDQDPRPFLIDLLSAADMYMNARGQESKGLGKNPELYHAMCSGLITISNDRVDRDMECLGKPKLGQDLADALAISELLLNEASDLRSIDDRYKYSQSVCEYFQTPNGPEAFENVIAGILDFEFKPKNDYSLQLWEQCLNDENVDANIAESILASKDLTNEQKVFFLCKLGTVLAEKMKFMNAIETFEKVLELDNSHEPAYFHLGKVSYICHSDTEALRFFRKVLATTANHADAMRYIACIYRRRGLSDDAIVWFKKAILADLDKKHYVLEICQTALECENIDHALAVLNAIMQILGETKALTMAIGQLHLKQGDYELGQKMLNKALDDIEEKDLAAK